MTSRCRLSIARRFGIVVAFTLAQAVTTACSSDGENKVAGTGGLYNSGLGGNSGAGTGGNGGAGASSTNCAVTPPLTWAAPNWVANTQVALALRERLNALTGSALMRGAETGAVTVTIADLITAYEAGTPSLKSVSTNYFRGLIDDTFDEFSAAVGAGMKDLVDTNGNWAPGAEGGIWSADTRAFNEGGLEIRQIADKGLFGGGALYNYALGLTTGVIDEATIDALAAAFGANSALNPGRNDDAVVENQNQHSANYVYRMGFYMRAKQALINAKSYSGNDTCAPERDAAIRGFFRAWEQGLFARFVYYSNVGANGVAEATDHEGLADAIHNQAEGLGLALGFYGVPNPASGPMSTGARLMTDERIASTLSALGVTVNGDLGGATLGNFVADPLGYASAVGNAEDVIASVFSLTEPELESYRVPTDG